MSSNLNDERVRKKAGYCVDIIDNLLPDMTVRARNDLSRILMDSCESKLRVVHQALRAGSVPEDPDVPPVPVTHDMKLPWE